MAHQSLYRKHRPNTFEKVVGQEHVTGILKSHIKSEKVPHAFLFAGGRGLGKTSVARIFARELGTTDKDIYEIDAASHNGVDEIRSLTENVYTLPFESKYKVYILDEVHMLSKPAWNAFLKTLEEPPAHTLFVMATTELEKVPETVRSRTEVFEFNKPTRKTLRKHLGDISKLEGYEIESSALDLLALLSDGSYRDALTLLEKVLSSGEGKTISREDVEEITGAPSHEVVYQFVKALSEKRAADALGAVSEVGERNLNSKIFITLALEYVRIVLLMKMAPDIAERSREEIGEDRFKELQGLAGGALSSRTLLVLLNALQRIGLSPVPELPLEIAVFELFAST